MCENAKGLYKAWRAFTDAGIKVPRMGLKCHKAGESFELELRGKEVK